MEIGPGDERRHTPGPGRTWEESWYLDFVSADGTLAGYVRMALRPGEGTAWFWAGMVGGGPTLVTLRDHEVPPPSGRGLEVRASGLWTELVCETPLEHWSVGMEAFGVALDDPLEAWGRERGDPWALGLDVEWEGTGPSEPWPGGYWQPCLVHGDVLVGAERFELDGSGVRLHIWGEPSWARWAAGRLDDGTSFAVPDVQAECDRHGLLRSVVAGDVTGTAVAAAPVLVPGEGRLARALCRYRAGDGAQGHGWAEWFHPSAPA
ncbi:MAG TPA: hypothetical protein VHF27_11110 [Acidimicrobiales bacterium]|nr:hypothetical protein [Acidimicrobiales bacterium]